MTDVSKEYAVALFELASEKGQEEAVHSGLATLVAAFAGAPEVYAFLAAPAVPRAERAALLRRALEGEVPEDVLSFVCLLAEQRQADLLPACAEGYNRLYEERFLVARVRVTSAVPLNDGEKARLSASLARRIGKKVELSYTVDPALLGGVRVETDGLVLDGSIKRRLQSIKEVMDE